MPREPQPRGPKSSAVLSDSADYAWLKNRPDRTAILEHARKTGAAIPKGLHLDAHGNSMIDADGVRHSWRLKDADVQTDYAVRARLRGIGCEVEEDKHG